MILKEFELKDGDLLKEYECEGCITSRIVGVVIGDGEDEYSTFEIPTQDLFNSYSDFAKDAYTLHEDMDEAINELDKIGKIVEAKKQELIAMMDKGNYPRVKANNCA